MTKYLPIPCPTCGGLVERQTLRCSCGAQWTDALELCHDGACQASDRAYKIADAGDWERPVQVMQDVMDAVSLEKKYVNEIEKMERTKQNGHA